VIRIVIHKALKGRFVAFGFVFADSGIVSKRKPGQIHIDKGRDIFVLFVETHQRLHQTQSLDRIGGLVGGFDLPVQKGFRIVKNRAVDRQFKRILAFGDGLFAGAVEIEGLMGEKIV